MCRTETILTEGPRRFQLVVSLAAAFGLMLACGCGSSPAIDLHGRVVFLGDSITARWHLQDFFRDQAINKGIEGQSAQQIAARFNSDVIALQPATVVILAGSNDVRAGTDLTVTRDAVATMVAMANASGIRPVVCTIPPMDGHMEDVKRYNDLLTTDPQVQVSCDYFRALTDQQGNPLPAILHDGLHPSAVGYLRMAVEISGALGVQ
jgi:lysophospholipase L1-like esterase